MNKTFKIVFNKARGALMVANEMTSSVQKKGVRTVVAMAAAAACGAVVAADAPDHGISNGTFSFSKNTTITTDVDAGEFDGDKPLAHFSGIAATKGETTVTVADGATLTIDGTLEEIDGADRIYLITAMNKSSVTTDGHISGKLSTSGSNSIRGIRADGGSTIKINGNLDADITSNNVESAGVEAYGGSFISFNGNETTLTATTSGNVYFIKNLENSTITPALKK